MSQSAKMPIHAKLLDDTRLCPDADPTEFATPFLDLVSCPLCAARLSGIQWRLDHHPTEPPLLELDGTSDRVRMIVLATVVALFAVLFVAALVAGQVHQ